MSDARIVQRVEKPSGVGCSVVHNETQFSALGYLDGEVLFVQFNNLDHPQSSGWWRYPAADFEIVHRADEVSK